jgi:predicted RNase H-like HicB family nuclease
MIWRENIWRLLKEPRVIPAFPGCYSQGETAEEALSNAREAILLTTEDMRARGDAIPTPLVLRPHVDLA